MDITLTLLIIVGGVLLIWLINETGKLQYRDGYIKGYSEASRECRIYGKTKKIKDLN